MSWVGAGLLAWSAIAIYACLFHGALYYYRRAAARAHLAFAVLCATHVVYFAGIVWHLHAVTAASASHALSLELAAGVCMSPAFLQFAAALSESRMARVLPTAWVSSVIAAFAALAGMGVAGAPEHWQPAGFGVDAPRLFTTLTPLGSAAAFVSVVWSSVGVVTLLRHPRDRAETRLVAFFAAPVFAGSAYTVSSAAQGEPIGWLAQLSCIPIALVCSLILLRRLAQSAMRLGAQSVELEHSYEQLRLTQEALVRKEQLAAVGELSAVIAHEVRNPLAILKNAASGLRQRALGSEDRRVLLGIVNEETERLARLVRDLLAYARPLSHVRTPTRLRELVERAWNDARLSKARGDAELEIDIGPDLAVMIDRDHATYAIVNVLDNALAAIGGRGTLHVRASSATDAGRAFVALDVVDEGPGMEPPVLAKAREPFFTTRPAGTGLGLAIVERIMRGHDGMLEIESGGEGTRVRLAFPAWDATSSVRSTRAGTAARAREGA